MLDEVGAGHVARIQGLLDVVEAHDGHEALGEHKWLDLANGPGTDFVALLVHGDDRLVGYAHLSRHGAHRRWGLELVVDPRHRGSEIEAALARRALAVSAERGGGPLHLVVFKPTEVHDELAAELGLTRERDLLHMRVPLPIDAELRLPEGYTLRTFEPGRDEDTWLEVNNLAFAEHPEQGEWDRATLERHMRLDWFDPDGFLLAFASDELVGFNWMKPNRDTSEGEIHVIGVDPSQQGAGLGRSLAIAGLRWAADQGLSTGTLYTDNEAAAEMYRSLGFEVDHVDRAYVTDV